MDEDGEKGVEEVEDKISQFWYLLWCTLDVYIHFSSTYFSFALKIENKYIWGEVEGSKSRHQKEYQLI